MLPNMNRKLRFYLILVSIILATIGLIADIINADLFTFNTIIFLGIYALDAYTIYYYKFIDKKGITP